MNLKEIFDKKNVAVKNCRDLLDRAEKEGRTLSAEESAQYDAWEQEIEQCNAQAQALERDQQRRKLIAQEEESLRRPAEGYLPQAKGTDGAAEQVDRRTLAERIRDGQEAGLSRAEVLQQVATECNERTKAQKRAFDQYLRTGRMTDRAALQRDVDAQGGFLTAPEQFVARLIQDLDRAVQLRQLGTVISLGSGERISWPKLDTDISDTVWTTELAIGTEDTAMAFGKRSMSTHPLAKYIKVSKELLRSNSISVEGIVRERLAYKFATVQEAAFMTGSGSGSPLGIFTASNAGISTSQDVSTGNTTTAITADGLINVKYTFESQWLSRPLRWLFHRDAVKMIRKLKDGDGQYLWQPGITEDMTDRILGYPVIMSEWAPNTFTSQQYVGMLADFSYYYIADSYGVEIERLTELGALTNQDYFIGRAKLDGMPILEKAFVRVKLA